MAVQVMVSHLRTTDLARARELTAALLDELGLRAYLYEVEPAGEQWRLRIECPNDGVWEVISLQIEDARLRAAEQDAEVREAIREAWRRQLAACAGVAPD